MSLYSLITSTYDMRMRLAKKYRCNARSIRAITNSRARHVRNKCWNRAVNASMYPGKLPWTHPTNPPRDGLITRYNIQPISRALISPVSMFINDWPENICRTWLIGLSRLKSGVRVCGASRKPNCNQLPSNFIAIAPQVINNVKLSNTCPASTATS